MRSSKNVLCFAITAAVLIMPAAITYADVRIDRIEAPSGVISAFERDHPTAAVSEYWKIDENSMTMYLIKATYDMKTVSLVYTASGNLVRTMEEITVDMLPAEVRATIEVKYPDEQIMVAQKILDGVDTRYETEMTKKDSSVHRVLFDILGRVLSDKPVEKVKKSEIGETDLA
jgi:hypothetical protein